MVIYLHVYLQLFFIQYMQCLMLDLALLWLWIQDSETKNVFSVSTFVFGFAVLR